MNVLYIVRGYPGLGRVMGSLAIASILQAMSASTRTLFASYLSGLRYLRNAGHETVDLYPHGFYPRPNAFCSPFGCEADVLAGAVQERSIDLVVIDGEPLLIDFVTTVLKLPLLVLTHPSDLHNPHSPSDGIDLFRLYYSRANYVIAHGLTRLPKERQDLGGRAGTVFEINTLVRPRIAAAAAARRGGLESPLGRGHVVGVMGGGSSNVLSSFAENTLLLAKWLVAACVSTGAERLTLFCADENIATSLNPAAQAGNIEIVSEQVDNVPALIDADLVVGRSGRNLVSEILALGVPAIIVPVPSEGYRYGDQIATAALAMKLAEEVRTFDLHEGEMALTSLVSQSLVRPCRPSTWVPGNEDVQSLLFTLLQRL
jgi:hypothetical protein